MANVSYSMAHGSLEGQPLTDIIRLIRTPNVGPVTFFQLLRRYGTASNALNALPTLSIRGGRSKPLTACSREQAEKERTLTEKLGARMLMYGEAEYPRLLTTIPDAPPLLTVLGNRHLWQKMESLAIVGARNASAGGCAFAQKLARQAGEHHLLIASGLARGIDAFAHKGALEIGTVGVIAGGINTIYPPENKGLYEKLKELGAIISEQPFDKTPFSGSFPGRNRIIAGMSLGSAIIEAAPKSGSLITARLAAEYGREVFAVPGSPLDPRAKGCNRLIKDGAHMLEGIEDIVEQLNSLRGRFLAEAMQRTSYHVAEAPEDNDAALRDARTQLTERLSFTPITVDTLVALTDIPIATVLTVLLELELAGRLTRLSGGMVVLRHPSPAEEGLQLDFAS